MPTSALRLAERKEDAEGTVKYLWTLSDDTQVETVYFEQPAGAIQCVSCQTGCVVGCKFCATALQRPARNLTAEEIVAQAVAVDQDCRDNGKDVNWFSVTFSGMGEPMLNYDNVVAAVRGMHEWHDLDRVSVTTSGIVPKMRALTEEDVYVQLHVSLHATTDETRASLIPIARKWSIEEVLDAAAGYARRWDERVVVNYLLFAGINDSADDVSRLCDMLDPALFEVSLLLWNEIPGFGFSRISDSDVASFQERLTGAGLLSRAMPSRGRDIQAGCGQLVADR